MSYKKLSKIADDVSYDEIREQMLNNLQDRLDGGEIIDAAGADRPGEYVSYCTKDTYETAAKEFIEAYDLEENYGISTPEQLAKRTGIDTTKEYIKIALDWNDDGDFYCYSANDVESLEPAMDVYVDFMYELVKNEYITLDQVEFEDENSEEPYEWSDVIAELPDEIWDLL